MVLREFHRMCLPGRWALLAASWWEKLKAMHATRLVRQAWLADVDLMLRGCQDCWTYHFLSALQRLEVIDPQAWQPGLVGVTRDSIVGWVYIKH